MTELAEVHSQLADAEIEINQLRADKARAEARIKELEGALLEEIENAEKAEACCAEMRKALHSHHEWSKHQSRHNQIVYSGTLRADTEHALSSDCGKGYVKAETASCIQCGGKVYEGWVKKEELGPTIKMLECCLDYAMGKIRASFSGKQFGAEPIQAELARLQKLMEGK